MLVVGVEGTAGGSVAVYGVPTAGQDAFRTQPALDALVARGELPRLELPAELQDRFLALREGAAALELYLVCCAPHRLPSGGGKAEAARDDRRMAIDSLVKQAEAAGALYLDGYFASYEDLGVHALMLRDRPRTEAYQRAICGNPDLYKGKVVLDVGAGSGILSLFAAKAGARKVYAVEASEVAGLLRETVARNGYEAVVEVIQSPIEAVALPEAVDVIVSEWMGFYLLHESMLDSVLAARDRWLAPGGQLAPNTATIRAALVELDDLYTEQVSGWEEVYGFDFGAFVPHAKRSLAGRVVVDRAVDPAALLTDAVEVQSLDLLTVSGDCLGNVEQTLEFMARRDGRMHAVCLWFETGFPGEAAPVTLGTGPADPTTHWFQTLACFGEAFPLAAGTAVACALTMAKDPIHPRRYNISVELR